MPEKPEKNAYDILGVSRTASQDDIKKRYRELARQHHPDVNRENPAAAKMFARMTAAYKSISDPDSRAVYDADLVLKERQAQTARSRSAPSSPTPSSRPRSSSPPPTAASGPTQQQQNNAEALRLLSEAQASFARGRFVEARSLAEQSLRLNRKSDKAYEVLGDIYRLQGKTEEAINMYSMSLQLNPRNPQVMQRLERLTRMTGGPPTPSAQRVFFDNTPRPTATPTYTPRPTPSVNAPRSPVTRSPNLASPGVTRQSLGLLTVGFVGYAGVLMMIVYTLLYPGAAPQGGSFLPLVSQWNSTIWSILGLSGLLLGATMTITGVIRRLEDELVFRGSGRFLPMGVVMMVLAAINFYIAAIVYAVVSLLQDSFTSSMGRVLGVIIGIVVILSLVYSQGTLQVLLWGGNVVFLAFLLGWFVGDVFRSENV
jgi:tetratricopeptide (TPR) repeat protein